MIKRDGIYLICEPFSEQELNKMGIQVYSDPYTQEIWLVDTGHKQVFYGLQGDTKFVLAEISYEEFLSKKVIELVAQMIT